MKNKLIFILLPYFLSQNIISQVIIHEKTLGYRNDEILFETIELNDGNYLSLGWTFSIGNGDNDFYLVKTDQQGNKIWEKTFGGYEKETGISIKEFANGNLLLSGTTRSFGSGAGDCIFIITDKNGDKLKEFYHGSFGDDYLRESVITKDEKIIFVGYSNSFGHGRKDIIYGKFDLNGNLMWIKNIGGEFDDEGWGVIETTDSGYLVSGFITKSNSVTYSKNIKTDKDGIVIWEHERIQRNIEYGINSTVEDFNGGYISGHTIYNGSTGKSQIEIFKLSSTGQLESSKTYDKSFNIELRAIDKTICGYAIACSAWNQRDQSDIYILFTDHNFNEIKSFTIDKGGQDNAWKLSTKNNKTIISGSIENINDGNLDGIFNVFEIKKDENDSLKCLNIKTTEDAAIGYHDFFNTESTNFGNALQNGAYVVPGALGGLNVNRALLSFNLNEIPNTSSIVSARINLFALGPIGAVSGHEGNNESILQRVIQPWNEFNVTWLNQPQSTNANEIKLPKSTSPTQDYTNIDVLPLIKDILKNNNFGLLLKLKEEELNNVLLFHSSDYFNINKHPNLDVCYAKKIDTFYVSSYKDILKCIDEEITLGSKPNSIWNTGDTGPSILIKENGYYTATSFSNDTLFIDSFYVQQIQVPILELGDDIESCKFIPFSLEVNDKFDSYLWSTGDSLNELKIDIPGKYWLKAIDQCKNILFDTINILDYSSDTIRISKYLIPEEKIIIGNNQYEQLGSYTINLLNKYGCDSIIVIDIKSVNPILIYDFNKCNAIIGSTNMDYSEFSPGYKSQLECSDISASIAYRENRLMNKHSCTPGINSSIAMCIESLNSCEYKPGHEKSIKINLLFDPKGNDIILFQGLSFYTKAPAMFDWINGEKGLNNYPTKYGIRILLNETEIFSKTDINTSLDWTKEILNFSEMNQFTFFEKKNLTIEILPYCLVGNDSNVSAWDIDELNIFSTCVSKESIIREGTIATTTNKPLPESTIFLKDLSSEIKVSTTDRNGRYTFSVPNINQEIFIEPFNDENHIEGVSTIDLILIQRHILGIKPFTNFNQFIAADIDNNKKITAGDILELRKNILGIKSGFKNNRSWRFNQSLSQIQNENPYDIKEKTIYNYFKSRDKELNFTGIKIGDVSSIDQIINTEFRLSNSYNLIHHLNFKNDAYYLDFYSSEISNVQGLELHFGKHNFIFDKIISGKVELQEDDFNINESKGVISKIFDIPQTFQNNDLLFSIKLKLFPKNNIYYLDQESVNGEIYFNEDLNILPIKLNKVNPNEIEISKEISVFPNPFIKSTNIHLNVDKPTSLRVQIFGQNGTILSNVNYNIDKNNDTVALNQQFFEMAPGIYFVKIINENYSQIIKIISL